MNWYNETWYDEYVMAGGIMMVFLIPCSVIALTLIINGLFTLRRERLIPKRLLDLTRSAREPEEAEAAQRRLAADGSPLGRIAATLARIKPADEETLEREAGRIAGEQAMLVYQRRVAPLALLRNVSLYLGLLGTILGIMQAFGEFALGTDQSVASLGVGIKQALVTTMWGLCIAIPCMVFVHIFRQRLITCEKVLLPEAAIGIYERLRQSSDEGTATAD